MRCHGWVHFVVWDGGMIRLMFCGCWKVFLKGIVSSDLRYCLKL